MSIIKYAVLLVLLPVVAQAQDPAHDHSGAVYNAVRLETGYTWHDGKDVAQWDIDGWVGGDRHKLWLKGEGEGKNGDLSLLYSRNIATFWDAQIGVRQDIGDSDHTYLRAGVSGLAPYFFETEMHVFVRDDGAVSARLRQSNDWLLTNRLIAEPSLAVDYNAREDRALGLGTGLTEAEVALQVRYEISRRFAPYVALSHTQKLGSTRDMAQMSDKPTQETVASIGIRWLF
ncbi:copper resistance protein B [Asticcacaulis sp. BYS171W]|uniref:Copper resistance protein B n=1 Tax=Asticcacaulis aquaticus TaxID=2984212 RepID=A0ABT5HWW4_9CAUL|nr:copper resistance protein B [Asticcacaulis aquaticus]MDC7684529.1 copper resistance protein B [Asticcacaulis aquaticus]